MGFGFYFLLVWFWGFLVGFFGWFSPCYFIGKGQLEKVKKDGWLILLGEENFLHKHVYFSLFVKCPNPV